MEHLEQRIDTLTELVNTLVAALGQNATNVALAIPPRILLANAVGGEVLPPKEGGTPWLARHKPIPTCVEGTLSVDVETSPK